MDKRYFSTVIVRGRSLLRQLNDFEADLFHATIRSAASDASITTRATVAQESTAAANTSKKEEIFEIEGLLTLEQIGTFVDKGCSVIVEAEASTRARASNTSGFEDWLKSLKEG